MDFPMSTYFFALVFITLAGPEFYALGALRLGSFGDWNAYREKTVAYTLIADQPMSFSDARITSTALHLTKRAERRNRTVATEAEMNRWREKAGALFRSSDDLADLELLSFHPEVRKRDWTEHTFEPFRERLRTMQCTDVESIITEARAITRREGPLRWTIGIQGSGAGRVVARIWLGEMARNLDYVGRGTALGFLLGIVLDGGLGTSTYMTNLSLAGGLAGSALFGIRAYQDTSPIDAAENPDESSTRWKETIRPLVASILLVALFTGLIALAKRA